MRMPKKILWPEPGPRQLGRWHFWLPIGFGKLGIKIEGQKRLHDMTQDYIYEKNKARSIGMFEVVYDDHAQRVFYDVGCFVNHHGYERLMESGDIYFKIRMTPEHKKKYPQMFPIGNRATRPDEFLELLPSLRVLSTDGKFDRDIIAILRMTEYKIRVKAVEIVHERPWKSIEWLTPHPGRPAPPKGLFKPVKFPYDEYLRMQAHTKLGLALPGVGDLTFRQIELMAMGRPCVITEPTLQPVAKDGNCWITVKRDLSDFVEKVDYYIAHDDEREEIGMRGMEFYDRYYSPEGQARYVLETIEANP